MNSVNNPRKEALRRPKVPLSRRADKHWAVFLHTPEDQIDVELGRSERKCVDEVDFTSETHPVNLDPDRPVSAPPDRVDIAFGKGQEKVDKKYDSEYRFNGLYLILGIGSVLLYLADIVTDILLAHEYFAEGEVTFGIVTTVFIAGPSFVTTCFGIHWYWIDYNTEKNEIKRLREKYDKHWQPEHETPTWLWVLRFVVTILQLGTLIRTVEYLIYGVKSMKKKGTAKKKYHNLMLYEDLDASLLRLFEGFLEAAPQLIFQLYAWAALRPEEDVISLSKRIIFLVLSWGSLSLCLTSYHKSLRYSRSLKPNLSLKATPVYFIWRACEVGGRVLCFSLFAITYQAWVFVPIGFHWIIMILWIIQQKTRFYSKRWIETIFNIICGYVMIFCFLNLQDGHTRFRYIVYYLIFYLENFAMIFVWFRLLPSEGSWYDLYAFISVFIFFLLHIIFQLIYYKFFHPQKIAICLPCDRFILYESVCHELKDEEKYCYKEKNIEEQNRPRTLSDTSQDGSFNNSRSAPLLTNIIKHEEPLQTIEMKHLSTQVSSEGSASAQSADSSQSNENHTLTNDHTSKPMDIDDIRVHVTPES